MNRWQARSLKKRHSIDMSELLKLQEQSVELKKIQEEVRIPKVIRTIWNYAHKMTQGRILGND